MRISSFLDLKNQKFGELFVVKRITKVGVAPIKWECLCSCGKTTFVSTANLRNNTTKSCGCLRKKMLSETMKKHGLTKSRVYKIWSSMRTRTTNPKSTNYNLYGGRGINCCKSWENFKNFYKNMGDPPDGYSLDRIDVNKGYEPSNCRWASPKEQALNRRKTKLINEQSFENFLNTQNYLTKEQKTLLLKNWFN